MNPVGAKLCRLEDGSLMFHCPGCDAPHSVNVGEGSVPRWGWNGSGDAPTFTPSLKVTWPANPNAAEEFKEWRTERVCHSFVTDGRIQFLDDSSKHSLRGWHDIPDWETA